METDLIIQNNNEKNRNLSSLKIGRPHDSLVLTLIKHLTNDLSKHCDIIKNEKFFGSIKNKEKTPRTLNEINLEAIKIYFEQVSFYFDDTSL